MSVRTPLGTIGIRGTSAAGRVNPPDASGNTSASIVLLGPGPANNANERIGRITVTNGGTSVEITRSGFGTIIGGFGQPPSLPVRFEPGQIAALTGGLGTDGGARPTSNQSGAGENQASGGGGGTPGGSPGGNGQNGGGPAGGNPARTGGGPGPGGPGGPGGPPGPGSGPIGLGPVNALSGQNIGAGIEGAGLTGQIGGNAAQNNDEIIEALDPSNINTAITNYDQLRSIQTGTASITVTNAPLTHISGPHTNSGGSYNATLSIDFGARTLDFQVSSTNYFFNGSSPQTFGHNASAGGGTNSYVNDTGFVTGSDNSIDNASTFTTAPSDGSTVTVVGAVLNNLDTGKIAAQGTVSVTINNGTDVIAGASIRNLQ